MPPQTRNHLRQLLQELNPTYRHDFDKEKLDELEKSYPELIFAAEHHSDMLDKLQADVNDMPESSPTEKLAKESVRLELMKSRLQEKNNWLNVQITYDAILELRKAVEEFKQAGIKKEE